MAETPVHIQGDIPEGLERSPYINRDLAPIPAERRTWSALHLAALWAGICICVPTYSLASGMLAAGLSGGQAIFVILLGGSLAAIPMILAGHAGAKYGVPFPVLARSAFGVRGSVAVSLGRAVVGCGWFAIQTWAGAQALDLLLSAMLPDWARWFNGTWVCFMVLWIMSVYFVLSGTESIKFLQLYGSAFLLAAALAMLFWFRGQAHGLGWLAIQPGHPRAGGAPWRALFASLALVSGTWAALAINIADFTRFAPRQRSQVLGQALGLPVTTALFAFIGLAVASVTLALFGRAMWDPVTLFSHARNPLVLVLALLFVLVAVLTTSVPLHLVAAANGFSSLWPRGISFRVGGLLAAVLAFLVQPWRILEAPNGSLVTALARYSAFLGPVVGILVADYFIVRRRRLEVRELYREDGACWGRGGLNFAGLLSLLLGVVLMLVGVYVDRLRVLYDYAWFTGGLAGFAFYLLAAAADRPHPVATPPSQGIP